MAHSIMSTNVWVAGKTVRSLVDTCQHVVKRYTINILLTCCRKAKFHYAIQLANQLASWSATC